MHHLTELTFKEYQKITGGRPDLDTSPFYDIGWYIGAAVRHIESWFK